MTHNIRIREVVLSDGSAVFNVELNDDTTFTAVNEDAATALMISLVKLIKDHTVDETALSGNWWHVEA